MVLAGGIFLVGYAPVRYLTIAPATDEVDAIGYAVEWVCVTAVFGSVHFLLLLALTVSLFTRRPPSTNNAALTREAAFSELPRFPGHGRS
ncbi:hypothetical protein FRUB_03377 [Fimbriiglobus ruber]|uniref:Uncharacterized protein n=1 Tax=Fimbriiglobus ruber TaxID=1908690 RepID=A0A225DZ23_9BACT|nr:hypothetical protein FRUB_03377 [Fimbriiglobus ruber]